MSDPSRGTADRVVLSYRSADADGEWPLAGSEWIRDGVRDPTYLGYLRRVHAGPVEAGDEWEEFVSRGCTSPADVILRVESVDGGDVLGDRTAIEVRHRREVPAADA